MSAIKYLVLNKTDFDCALHDSEKAAIESAGSESEFWSNEQIVVAIDVEAIQVVYTEYTSPVTKVTKYE